MSLALRLLPLCLHVVARPRWLRGGGGTTLPPGTLPVTPSACYGGDGSGSSPGTALGTGPPSRQKGVYTPTAHEGAPGRGAGPGPLLGGGAPALPVARGPTQEWGAGNMSRGTAAAALRTPLAPEVTGTVARRPPPPPGRSIIHGTGRHRLPPNRGAMGLGCAAAGGHGTHAPTPTDSSAKTRRGAKLDAPDQPLGTLPAAPRASIGGNGGGPSTAGLPLGMGSGTGPSMRQEGVYTPTAQEGAPRGGDGPGPLSVGGFRLGSERTPHRCGAVARWHGTKPPRRCSCHSRCAQRGVCQGTPLPSLPPPGKTAAANQTDRVHRVPGGWLGWPSRRHDAALPPIPPPPDQCPGPHATCPGTPATCHWLFLPMGRGLQGLGRGRGHGHGGPAPPLPWDRRRHPGLLRPGHPRVPHPPPAPGVARHLLCPGPPRGAMSWGPTPPGKSLPAPGTGGGTPTNIARTAQSGRSPTRAPMAPSSGPRGPLWAWLCNAGTPRSSSRLPPAYTCCSCLAPMWQEESGAALWRPTRHGRLVPLGDQPAC